MGHALMPLVILSVLLPTVASADTVYLKNGQSVWGRSTWEEEEHVVINRPTGQVRVPKASVYRVEPIRNTLPPHYVPPVLAPIIPAAPLPPTALPAAAPRASMNPPADKPTPLPDIPGLPAQ